MNSTFSPLSCNAPLKVRRTSVLLPVNFRPEYRRLLNLEQQLQPKRNWRIREGWKGKKEEGLR
jgi:hypothetical protein